MHGKERVIAPALAALGLTCLPSPAAATDRFGTFTRDIGRAGNQTDALLAKARAGFVLAPLADFAVASEGAFGPHPEIPFIASNLELAGMVERTSGQAVIGRHLTTDTNFRQAEAGSWGEVEVFAQAIGFPGHALVVMGSRDGPVLAKGVTETDALKALCLARFELGAPVWLESDMRAHANPTRMDAVAAATADLVRRLQARCPACAYPDWTPRTAAGRPCAWCNGPTNEAWTEVYLCGACGHRAEQRIAPDRKADPGHCPSCNP